MASYEPETVVGSGHLYRPLGHGLYSGGTVIVNHPAVILVR